MLPLDRFWKANTGHRKDGRQRWCIDCYAVYRSHKAPSAPRDKSWASTAEYQRDYHARLSQAKKRQYYENAKRKRHLKKLAAQSGLAEHQDRMLDAATQRFRAAGYSKEFARARAVAAMGTHMKVDER